MENSKLKVPLFYDRSFNRDGHRMRAVFEREITNGIETYCLWRSAGQPDLSYPRAENDKYILYVEINGYLATLGMTDFALVHNCGFEPAAQKLYGGKENRGKWINAIEQSGGRDAVSAAVAEEQNEIERYGSEPARQAEYIQHLLNKDVSAYQLAKENGGQSHPNFIGALVMNDLARCMELSVAYRATQKEDAAAKQAKAIEEETAYCDARNQEAEQAVADAVQIILDGGVLKNKTVQLYRSKYDYSDYSIINYLMRLYQVDVPLRTQGWINEKLASATIEDGKCEHLQFFRSKNGRCSQKFFECMDNLIQAVKASIPRFDREEVA